MKMLQWLFALVCATFFDSKDSPEDEAMFVGCYKTTYARANDYNNDVTPLTWDVCIRLCDDKDARYAGVEAMESTCYCGNQLAEMSEKVEPQMCDEECYGDRTKTCGSDDNLMSMYGLKNTTSFAFLATTDNGLAYFKNNQLYRNFVSLPKVSPIKAAYYYAKNQVFFYWKNAIRKSKYVPVMREHMPPVEFLDVNGEVSSLALDWVHQKLFWGRAPDLMECNLDGSDQMEVVKLGTQALDISVDPYDRKLFFISNGSVHQFDLKSRKSVNKNMFQYNRFEMVTHLTVDVHKKTVYAVGSYTHGGGNRFLVSIDYGAVMFRVLLHRNSMAHGFSLNALNSQIFWGELDNQKQEKTLQAYKVPADSTLRKPNHMAKLPMHVQNIILYHEHAQTPGKVYFCEKLKCKHECVYSLATSAKCTCPENMVLAKDHRTCKYILGFDPEDQDGVFPDEDIDNGLLEIYIDDEFKESSNKGRRREKKRKSDTKKESHSLHQQHSHRKLQTRNLPINFNITKNDSLYQIHFNNTKNDSLHQRHTHTHGHLQTRNLPTNFNNTNKGSFHQIHTQGLRQSKNLPINFNDTKKDALHHKPTHGYMQT